MGVHDCKLSLGKTLPPVDLLCSLGKALSCTWNHHLSCTCSGGCVGWRAADSWASWSYCTCVVTRLKRSPSALAGHSVSLGLQTVISPTWIPVSPLPSSLSR